MNEGGKSMREENEAILEPREPEKKGGKREAEKRTKERAFPTTAFYKGETWKQLIQCVDRLLVRFAPFPRNIGVFVSRHFFICFISHHYSVVFLQLRQRVAVKIIPSPAGTKKTGPPTLVQKTTHFRQSENPPIIAGIHASSHLLQRNSRCIGFLR